MALLRPSASAGDDFDKAAQAAGVQTPNANVDTDSTHVIWKILFFPLAFKNLKAGLYVLAGVLTAGLVWYFVGWQPLLAGPVSGAFAWYWWKTHYHVEMVMLIEVRSEGQKFRPPHLPFPYKVRDSCFRVFAGPRKVYDRAIKYGTFKPIYDVPPNVVICDWFDPERNVVIFNEDPEWNNFAIVAQMNEGLAKNLRRRSRKEDWLTLKEKEAVMHFKAGHISKETLESILMDVEEQLDIVQESPYTKRSFAHYYQDTIPRLKRQVIELLKGIEELSFAIGAEIAYDLYNQPMSPEIEQEISWVKTKYGKLKVGLFDEFDLMPEIYEQLGEVSSQQTPVLHALSQKAAAFSSRPHNMSPEREIVERPI